MPKSKSEMNKRLRQQRIAAGLVEVRVWVKPEKRQDIINHAKKVNESNN